MKKVWKQTKWDKCSSLSVTRIMCQLLKSIVGGGTWNEVTAADKEWNEKGLRPGSGHSRWRQGCIYTWVDELIKCRCVDRSRFAVWTLIRDKETMCHDHECHAHKYVDGWAQETQEKEKVKTKQKRDNLEVWLWHTGQTGSKAPWIELMPECFCSILSKDHSHVFTATDCL